MTELGLYWGVFFHVGRGRLKFETYGGHQLRWLWWDIKFWKDIGNVERLGWNCAILTWKPWRYGIFLQLKRKETLIPTLVSAGRQSKTPLWTYGPHDTFDALMILAYGLDFLNRKEKKFQPVSQCASSHFYPPTPKTKQKLICMVGSNGIVDYRDRLVQDRLTRGFVICLFLLTLRTFQL